MKSFQHPVVGNSQQNANQVNEGFNYPTLMEESVGLNIGLQQNVVPILVQNNPMQRYQQQMDKQLQNEQVQLHQVLTQIGLNQEAIEEQKIAYQYYNEISKKKSNSDEIINQQQMDEQLQNEQVQLHQVLAQIGFNQEAIEEQKIAYQQYNEISKKKSNSDEIINQQQMVCNQGNFILEISNYEQPNYPSNSLLSPYSQKQKTGEPKILAGILVNLEKQKITMLIRAYQKGNQVSSQCCFLRNNQEQFFQPMQRKQTFCIDKDNGDLLIYNNNQLLHFTQNGENWMVASSIILFKPEDYQLKVPLLHILKNQMNSKKILLMIEQTQMIIIDIDSHQIIKTLVLPEVKSRPILFSDNNYLYLIGGKENYSSTFKIQLTQLYHIHNVTQEIKITQMTIKFEQWAITKSRQINLIMELFLSLHDAIIINVKGNLYVLGRKQAKSLELIISNQQNTMIFKYTDNNYLKLNEKMYLIESNIANINGQQIIYLSEDLQKQIIKTLKI